MLVKQPWPNLTVIMDMKTSSINTERETDSFSAKDELLVYSILTYLLSENIFNIFATAYVRTLELGHNTGDCRSEEFLQV